MTHRKDIMSGCDVLVRWTCVVDEKTHTRYGHEYLRCKRGLETFIAPPYRDMFCKADTFEVVQSGGT
jgi:hypothetical protein